MAVYGISKEGANALKQLATDMSNLNNDIQECGKKLTAKIGGLGEGLGIYESQILELVAGVNQSRQLGQHLRVPAGGRLINRDSLCEGIFLYRR